MTVGLYIHRTTPIHALPAAAKLAVLAAAGLAVFLTRDLAALGAALAAVLALFALARLPWRELVHQIKPAFWLLAILFLVHWAITDWQQGLLAVLRFGVLILLATLITFTTRVSDMIDVIERGLEPLRRFGANPARLGLMLSMAIRFIPLLFALYHEIREAQAARGLQRNVFALLLPLLVRTLRLADDITDALEARCFDAEEADPVPRRRPSG